MRASVQFHASSALMTHGPDPSVHRSRLDDAGYVNLVGLKGGFYAWCALLTASVHSKELACRSHSLRLDIPALHTCYRR